MAIEALNWRVVAAGPRPTFTMSAASAGAAPARPRRAKGSRRAYFPEAQGYVDTPVYDRYALRPGAELAGPAIIEERESTTRDRAGRAGARGPGPDHRGRARA